MSVLVEAESLANYSHKRLALSYERATPQSTKSHSQKEDNMKWNVSAAMLEFKNFPSNENINCLKNMISLRKILGRF